MLLIPPEGPRRSGGSSVVVRHIIRHVSGQCGGLEGVGSHNREQASSLICGARERPALPPTPGPEGAGAPRSPRVGGGRLLSSRSGSPGQLQRLVPFLLFAKHRAGLITVQRMPLLWTCHKHDKVAVDPAVSAVGKTVTVSAYRPCPPGVNASRKSHWRGHTLEIILPHLQRSQMNLSNSGHLTRLYKGQHLVLGRRWGCKGEDRVCTPGCPLLRG